MMENLIDNEKALHQVWFNHNPSVVKRLLHPDFKEVSESGRGHDYQDLSALQNTQPVATLSVHGQNYECVMLSDDSYLVLYQSALFNAQGEYHSFAKRASVWVKRDDRWQMQYHQGTYCDRFDIV